MSQGAQLSAGGGWGQIAICVMPNCRLHHEIWVFPFTGHMRDNNTLKSIARSVNSPLILLKCLWLISRFWSVNSPLILLKNLLVISLPCASSPFFLNICLKSILSQYCLKSILSQYFASRLCGDRAPIGYTASLGTHSCKLDYLLSNCFEQ